MPKSIYRGVKKNTFDCIVIDLFIGRDIPDFVSSRDYLQAIHGLLSPDGFIFINYLKELEYGLKPSRMTKTLQKYFHSSSMWTMNTIDFFLAKRVSRPHPIIT